MSPDSTPITLLWWLPEYPPDAGGIATFAAHVAPELARRGHEVTALVVRGPSNRSVVDGVRIIREPYREALEAGDAMRTIRLQSLTRKVKEEVAPDLYHVHMCEPSPFLHLTTIDVAAAPTVLTLHNEHLDGLDADDPNTLTHRLFDSSSVITCVSTTSARFFANRMPRYSHKIVAIPNGAPVPASVTPLPASPRILAIGRLVEQKGFDRLLASMPVVVAAVPLVRLDILGDGPDRADLEHQIVELGLSENVTMHGHVQRDHVAGWVSEATIVAAPSRYEGLPYAALEAAGGGRAIVATRVSGIDEVVVHGETGILVDNAATDDDPAVLAGAIIGLLDNGPRAAALGMAGRERAQKMFSLDACVDAYEHVYRSVSRPETHLAVIVPVHNGERHLAAALEAALADIADSGVTAQVLVVDDGSTDASVDIARRYADRGVEVFSQPQLGAGMARNTGIALTRSRWIGYLDADDLWPIGRLAALLAAAESDDGSDAPDVVVGRAVEFADNDAPLNAKVHTEPQLVRVASAGIVRRNAHDVVGGFATGESNDHAEWASRSIDAGLRYTSIDHVVLQRRIHGNNKSHKRPFTTDPSRIDMIKQHLDRIGRRGDLSSSPAPDSANADVSPPTP